MTLIKNKNGIFNLCHTIELGRRKIEEEKSNYKYNFNDSVLHLGVYHDHVWHEIGCADTQTHRRARLRELSSTVHRLS